MRVMSTIEMFVTSSSTLMLILVIYGLGQMANWAQNLIKPPADGFLMGKFLFIKLCVDLA